MKPPGVVGAVAVLAVDAVVVVPAAGGAATFVDMLLVAVAVVPLATAVFITVTSGLPVGRLIFPGSHSR